MTDLIWYNYAVYKYACHSLLVKFMFPWQRCKRDDQKIIDSDIIKQIKSRKVEFTSCQFNKSISLLA